MTIAELGELLANYPQDLPVMIDGYEGGFDDVDIGRIAIREIQLDVNKYWFYGRHDLPGEDKPPSPRDIGDPPNRHGPVVSALVISRERNRGDRILTKQPDANPAD